MKDPIILNCEQGSSEWHKARLGIPTASHFDDIITPAQRKPSSSAHGYMMKLLSEWLIGVPSDSEAYGFMDRGTQLEPKAAEWYSFERGVDAQKVGIVLRHDRMVGCSPDRLVGDDGLLEIKCPGAPRHVQNLLDGMGGYVGQTQGALWLTGRKWIDLLSYNPEITPVVVRIERDEEYIQALSDAVGLFVTRMIVYRNRLLELGCKPATRLLIPVGMATEDPF